MCNLIQVKGDGSQNRKEALSHLHRMEEEMKQAEVKMKEDKEAKEAAREKERKRQTVVTPGGGQGYATPKRTPQRFGL